MCCSSGDHSTCFYFIDTPFFFFFFCFLAYLAQEARLVKLLTGEREDSQVSMAIHSRSTNPVL